MSETTKIETRGEWVPVPLDIIPDLDGSVSVSRATGWIYMIGRWVRGEDPSVREFVDRLGWGWERTAREYQEARAWSIAAGNPVPDSVRARVIGASRERPPEEGDEDFTGVTLTHAEVVQRAVRWLRNQHNCKAVFAEIVTYERVNPDAIGFRKSAGAVSSWSVLVEAKISRSDFRADREKVIHRLPDSCPGQERWYLTPPNMVRPEEVPEGWGLAECGKRSVRIVKPAPIGAFSVERAHADMGILLSAVRRHECGAKWFEETARFEPYSATRMEAK